MTLEEFRNATAHLSGDLEFLCAGGEIGLLWHDDGFVSIDDDAVYLLEDGKTVLFRGVEFDEDTEDLERWIRGLEPVRKEAKEKQNVAQFT